VSGGERKERHEETDRKGKGRGRTGRRGGKGRGKGRRGIEGVTRAGQARIKARAGRDKRRKSLPSLLPLGRTVIPGLVRAGVTVVAKASGSPDLSSPSPSSPFSLFLLIGDEAVAILSSPSPPSSPALETHLPLSLLLFFLFRLRRQRGRGRGPPRAERRGWGLLRRGGRGRKGRRLGRGCGGGAVSRAVQILTSKTRGRGEGEQRGGAEEKAQSRGEEGDRRRGEGRQEDRGGVGTSRGRLGGEPTSPPLLPSKVSFPLSPSTSSPAFGAVGWSLSGGAE